MTPSRLVLLLLLLALGVLASRWWSRRKRRSTIPFRGDESRYKLVRYAVVRLEDAERLQPLKLYK